MKMTRIVEKARKRRAILLKRFEALNKRGRMTITMFASLYSVTYARMQKILSDARADRLQNIF